MPFTSHAFSPSSSHEPSKVQVPLWSLMTPCGYHSLVKSVGSSWEKLYFHSFVPLPTAQMNLWFNCPGTFVPRLGSGVNASLCYSRQASCGAYLPRIHTRFSSVLFTHSPCSMSICSTKFSGGWGGHFLLSLQPPLTPSPWGKMLPCMLPVGEARLASCLSNQPEIQGASPATSPPPLPHLNLMSK